MTVGRESGDWSSCVLTEADAEPYRTVCLSTYYVVEITVVEFGERRVSTSVENAKKKKE